MADQVDFGKTRNGKTAQLYTIKNGKGMSLSVTDYGAAMVKLLVPDSNGKLIDVIWGFENVSGYEATPTYMGATIGRHAGQIEKGRFMLNGTEYKLVINDHDHTMHGGPEGFHSRMFELKDFDESKIMLLYRSPSLEAGFPGSLDVYVTYELTDDNELIIDFEGISDDNTVLSMTNHAYFNLDGEASDSILTHRLRIPAKQYTQVDNQGLPTGRVLDVAGSPFDFNQFREVGKLISDPHEELKFCKGYDHNWIIDADESYNGLRLNCELMNSQGTVHMKLYSNQPGLQMYSGNYLNGSDVGKNGKAYVFRSALCLEPQKFPNGLNHPHFPSPILKAGEDYVYKSVYKFS